MANFTRRKFIQVAGGAAAGEAAFDAVFLFFLLPLALGLAVYLLSRDRAD